MERSYSFVSYGSTKIPHFFEGGQENDNNLIRNGIFERISAIIFSAAAKIYIILVVFRAMIIRTVVRAKFAEIVKKFYSGC